MSRIPKPKNKAHPRECIVFELPCLKDKGKHLVSPSELRHYLSVGRVLPHTMLPFFVRGQGVRGNGSESRSNLFSICTEVFAVLAPMEHETTARHHVHQRMT